jgi:autoinducer 2-degrading protein
MIVTVVHVRVKDEHVGEFIHATLENHLASRGEPGNLRFDVLRDRNDPALFILYEAYATEAAAAAHKKTAHYQKWCEAVEPWMAKPRERVHCSVVAPEGADQW